MTISVQLKLKLGLILAKSWDDPEPKHRLIGHKKPQNEPPKAKSRKAWKMKAINVYEYMPKTNWNPPQHQN